MQLRPLTPQDLSQLEEIDATIDSSQYIHIDRQQTEATEDRAAVLAFTMQDRPTRERLTAANRLGDETQFLAKQIATGTDEGIALVADHDGQLVGFLLAQADPGHRTLNLLDLRVDYDFRRQGLGLALLYQLMSAARDQEMRAVRAETPANNFPAIQLLRKVSFELAGLDTHRHSNHDLVKEQVTLLWYAALD